MAPIDRRPRSEKTRHRKRSGPNQIEWDAVREHWLAMNMDPLRDPKLGEYSLKECAKLFKIASGTVQNKASEHGWRKELQRRQKAIADGALAQVQETAIAVEAEIRTGQITLAKGLYTLIAPIIRGYQKKIDDDGCLTVTDKALGLFLSAMKEARAAAGFGNAVEQGSEDAALERIAKHQRTGGLLAELLDDVETERSKS